MRRPSYARPLALVGLSHVQVCISVFVRMTSLPFTSAQISEVITVARPTDARPYPRVAAAMQTDEPETDGEWWYGTRAEHR